MKQTNDADPFTATDLRIALNDVYLDSTDGTGPIIDQHDALEAYLAFADGALAEVPGALAAYVDHQQLDIV